MAKIFERSEGPKTDIKRNTFDMSFASHLSTKIGQITPILCKEVLPGDSFEIQVALGLRFAPMVFPVQTKIHVVTHYFYCRNRNLYDGWQEYIGKTDPSAVFPYRTISPADAKSQIGTGSLGDYLGIPSTIVGNYGSLASLPLVNRVHRSSAETTSLKEITFESRVAPSSSYTGCPIFMGDVLSADADDAMKRLVNAPKTYNNQYGRRVSNNYGSQWVNWVGDVYGPYFYVYATLIPFTSYFKAGKLSFVGASSATPTTASSIDAYVVLAQSDDTLDNANFVGYFQVRLTYASNTWSCNLSDDLVDQFNSIVDFNRNNYLCVFVEHNSKTAALISDYNVSSSSSEFRTLGTSIIVPQQYNATKDATDDDVVELNPFVGNSPKIPINVLPFRAYEAIYNSFYRNEIVDPLILDGKPTYNKYNRNIAGGADALNYDLHFRNWEADYFTSCQPSPQMGLAPLVGVSASGEFTFKNEDTGEVYKAQTTIGDDGETIVGISTYDPSMPPGTLRKLMDTITNGISINDFRNVNSLQRWLETNIRRGYKYVDQIESHFGVTPAFKANDMPEFLGGSHQIVDVNTITNMADNLGEFAGQASAIGGLENTIHKYCDEHGYIMGLMMVYPEPVYSQMLPKHFTKTVTPLDYFFPEFGHIGLQPVTYREVTPIQTAAEDFATGQHTIDDVFGYQRAWADYIASNDEVHGEMRASLSNYVIARTFDSKPQLGRRFITIHPDDVNDVFKYTGDDSKIYGQVRIRMYAKRPIPRFGIPRLE